MTLRGLLLTGILAVPAAASAQDHWSAEVTIRLQRGGERLETHGYHQAGVVAAGSLFVDETASALIQAADGNETLFLGACDPDCTGLGLVLTDAAGYQLDADRGPGITPVVRLPAGTARGPFRLTVILSGCRVSPCRYGVARYQRRPIRPPPARRAG